MFNTPQKNSLHVCFGVLNNSFDMKLKGAASGVVSQGDTEQKLKLKAFSHGRKA